MNLLRAASYIAVGINMYAGFYLMTCGNKQRKSNANLLAEIKNLSKKEKKSKDKKKRIDDEKLAYTTKIFEEDDNIDEITSGLIYRMLSDDEIPFDKFTAMVDGLIETVKEVKHEDEKEA